ncbi:hypothetical protein Pelo_3004 [Pelomyxa schiedti]|nr:hypothetical protein Pelo_3004 [Pelomyxa schiedti]
MHPSTSVSSRLRQQPPENLARRSLPPVPNVDLASELQQAFNKPRKGGATNLSTDVKNNSETTSRDTLASTQTSKDHFHFQNDRHQTDIPSAKPTKPSTAETPLTPTTNLSLSSPIEPTNTTTTMQGSLLPSTRSATTANSTYVLTAQTSEVLLQKHQNTDIHTQTLVQPPQVTTPEQSPSSEPGIFSKIARLATEPFLQSEISDLQNENKKLISIVVSLERHATSLEDENNTLHRSLDKASVDFSQLQGRTKALEEHNAKNKELVERLQRDNLVMRGQLLESEICTQGEGEEGLIELGGLQIVTARPIGMGCNGCVNAVLVLAPNAEIKEVALKMLFNLSAGATTIQIKDRFDCEYRVGLLHPHWCMAIIFNSFRGKTMLELMPPDLRPQYCLVDEDGVRIEGTKGGIPFFHRTSYLTMELGKCNVETLVADKFHREERKPLPAEFGGKNPLHVGSLAFCVLSAVDNLNSHWWFHTDIKLDNILVVQRPTTTAIFHAISGNIYTLCDLGTALHCPSGEHTLRSGDTVEGNGINRSPELHRASIKFSLTKNDVWAVGCVLYEVITGHHPYCRNRDIDENLLRNVKSPFLIPDEFVDSTPVAALVPYLLERYPAIRPTAKHALLICGAILFLAPHTVNISSTRPDHIRQSIDFFTNNSAQVQSTLLHILRKNIESFAPSSLSSASPTAAEKTPSVEQVCSLVFANKALRDVEGFCAVMLAFCQRRAVYYNVTSPTQWPRSNKRSEVLHLNIESWSRRSRQHHPAQKTPSRCALSCVPL